MINSPWVQLKQENDQYCFLYLNLGTKNKLVRLPIKQAPQVCKRLIIDAIRRYIKQRKHIINRYTDRKDQKALIALNHLEYAFMGSINRWSYQDLPRIIKNWENDLLTIAPGVNSKFYKSNTQFLLDLLAWANHELKVHHGAD